MALEVLAIALATVCVVLALIYRYLTSTFNYFQKHGLSGPKPTPIFGTWWGIWNQFQGEQDLNNIREYGQVYGSFTGRTPTVVTSHPSVVKTVLGREAASFKDRRACSVRDPLLRQALVSLGKSEKTTPSFLVHEKLRAVTPSLLKVAEGLASDIKQDIEVNEGKVNILKQVSNFLANLLAVAVFGIDLEKSPEMKEQFIQFLEQVFFNANADSALSLVPFLYPSVTSLDDYVLSKKGFRFFTSLCRSAIEERRKSQPTEGGAKDFVGLCVEAAEEERTTLGKLKVDAEVETTPPTPTPTPTLTDDRLVAECLAVVINTSLVTKKLVALSAHVLASKPEAQDKLHAEVANQSQSQDGFSYEAINGAKYLNMFISEIERIYPSEFRLERNCCDSMEVEKYKIDRGSIVAIPVYAIHHLQDFYPDPEKFDPERFSPENEEKRVLGTYLPFGQLGSTTGNLNVQFGILAAKMAVTNIVKKFKFSPAEETQIPPEFEKGMTGILRPREIVLTAEARP